MKIRENYTCPLEFVHDLIRGKWKTIIVFKLRNGSMSLSELENGIEGISQKMLLQHLKELQAYDIVRKKSYEGYPLKVAYFLSPKRGRKILESINLMQEIGIEIMVDRGAFDVLDDKGIDYSCFIKDTDKKVIA